MIKILIEVDMTEGDLKEFQSLPEDRQIRFIIKQLEYGFYAGIEKVEEK